MTYKLQILTGKIGDINYDCFDLMADRMYKVTYPEQRNNVQKINRLLADEYFVVINDGKLVARCVTYINEKIIHNDSNPYFFGSFECVDDQVVCDFLIAQVTQAAMRLKKKELIGPLSGSTWYDYRIALPAEEGKPENPVFFTEFFTPPYYKKLLSGSGFEVLESYKSTHATSYEVNEKKLQQCERMFEEKGIWVRRLNINNFERDLEHIYHVSIEGFRNNFLYSPISKEEFLLKYLPLKQIAHPSTIFLAFEEDTCVGFSMSLPNLYNRKQLVMKSAARAPGFKYNGLGTWFNELTKKGAKEEGYEELIVAFLIDDGVSERTFSNANDNELYREYELLIKKC